MSKKIISMLFIGLMLSLALSYTVQAGDTGKQTGLLYFDDDGAFQNGYNLFTKLSATTVYLTDTMGRVVNTWTDTATTGLSLYLRTDGDLLRTTKSDDSTVGVSGRFSAGGVGGRVKRISWGGSVEWNYIYSTSLHRSHHDIEELPNGNILMVAWEYKNQTECLNAGRYSNQMTAGELWPDTIVEVNPSTSQIVWEWHFWDHLSCDRAGSWTANGRAVSSDTTDSGLVDINYCPDTTADWTHTNAVDYNADLNQIVISCRSLDEIYIIDHDTTTQEAIGSAGKFLYRWGNPLAYQTGSSTNHKLFGQHNIQWIPDGYPGEGNLLCYNNGNGRFGGNYSSADEWIPPLSGSTYTKMGSGAFNPAGLTWTYADGGSFYSAFISGAQRQPNGNTLICVGQNGYIFEVTDSDEVVWEYQNPISGTSASTFRFERYPPDFAGFSGKDMTPGDCIEGGCTTGGGGGGGYYEGTYAMSSTVTSGTMYNQLTRMVIDADGDVTGYAGSSSGTGTVDEEGDLFFEISYMNFTGDINEDWDVTGTFDNDKGYNAGTFSGYCTTCGGGGSYCGDGNCDPDEDEITCPADCGGGGVEYYEGTYAMSSTATSGTMYNKLTRMVIDADGDVTGYAGSSSGTGTVDEEGDLFFEISYMNFTGDINEDWDVTGTFDNDKGYNAGTFSGYCTNCN